MGLLATELILVSLFPYQLSVVYRLVQGAVTRVHDANWMGNILVSSRPKNKQKKNSYGPKSLQKIQFAQFRLENTVYSLQADQPIRLVSKLL